MADLENQQTPAQEPELELASIAAADTQASFISESPALAALEAKLLRRRKRAEPNTYRRPAYLQYIDYV